MPETPCSAPPAAIFPPGEIPMAVEPKVFTPVHRSIWGHFVWGVLHGADFSGRATRAEFWSFAAVYLALLIGVPAVLLFPLAGVLEDASALSVASASAAIAGSVLRQIAALWVTVVFIGGILPNWAVACRRLHDVGFSGALVLINVVPCLGTLAFLVFTLIDSEHGANRYGPATIYP